MKVESWQCRAEPGSTGRARQCRAEQVRARRGGKGEGLGRARGGKGEGLGRARAGRGRSGQGKAWLKRAMPGWVGIGWDEQG